MLCPICGEPLVSSLTGRTSIVDNMYCGRCKRSYGFANPKDANRFIRPAKEVHHAPLGVTASFHNWVNNRHVEKLPPNLTFGQIVKCIEDVEIFFASRKARAQGDRLKRDIGFDGLEPT